MVNFELFKNSRISIGGTTKNLHGQKLGQLKIRFSGQIETPAWLADLTDVTLVSDDSYSDDYMIN